METLASMTGLNINSVYNCLRGYRIRRNSRGKTKKVPTRPQVRTVVLISAVLGIEPEQLRETGREDAADMLAHLPAKEKPEQCVSSPQPAINPVDMRIAHAVFSTRAALIRDLLQIVSTDELRDELQRREKGVRRGEDGSETDA